MRARRPLTAVLAATVGVALLVPSATAQEADGPSSAQVERRLATAEERLAELEAAASAAVEDVNEAQVALDAAESELAATSAAAEVAAARSAELREATDAVARSLYKNGGTNLQFGAVLGADGPTEAGVRYAAVRRVIQDHRGDVESLRAALTEMDALEARLAEQRDAAAQRAEELEDRRTRLEATLAGQADEIVALETELAEAREREEAARRAAEEAARREAEAAERRAAERRAAREQAARDETSTPAPSRPTAGSGGGGGRGSGGGGGAATTPAPTTRQSAQVAVDTALAQVGKPYRWGGGGPGSFDCSGLTSFAWRAAGVSLPHSSRAQYGATKRVSRGDLQPGDLVFFGSPIHHVAMYIGGGQVVEASRAGVPVRVSSRSLNRSDVAGYGRP